MESSRRDLLNDLAEHRPILKNNQNTYHSRLGFVSKTGIAFSKTGFCFYCADVRWTLCFYSPSLKRTIVHIFSADINLSVEPSFSCSRKIISKEKQVRWDDEDIPIIEKIKLIGTLAFNVAILKVFEAPLQTRWGKQTKFRTQFRDKRLQHLISAVFIKQLGTLPKL